jgi:hypothetical protein
MAITISSSSVRARGRDTLVWKLAPSGKRILLIERGAVFQWATSRLSANSTATRLRGENSGRKLNHDFVVLQLAKTEMVNEGNHWTGTVSLSTNAATDKPTALAAWIKSAEIAPPIQATGGWLKQ